MLKFALIGCGRIAVRHSQLLGENNIKGAKLVAVCDPNLEKCIDIASKYDIPHYEDMHKMMLSEDIDVAVVLTPSGMHASNVIELSKYGKHIIVEKPMALKLKDADLMIEACRKNKCLLFVVKQNRFNVPVKKLRQAIEENRFGKIFMGTTRVRWARHQEYYDQDEWRGTWLNDGGVLTNQASHHIDLLEWMLGEVDSVFARSTQAIAKIETEDTAVVILNFKNGSLGIIEATTATRPKDLEGSLSIMGEKGSVVIGGFSVNKMNTWNFEDPTADDKEVIERFSENPPNVYGFGHKSYYDSVVDCINNDGKDIVDGKEGRKSLQLINAIYHSIETGKEVYMSSEIPETKLGN
tara:strand:+ start:3975 stop:5030 length:1056 start_codon:yes stop_codon:yes gene_type:complete